MCNSGGPILSSKHHPISGQPALNQFPTLSTIDHGRLLIPSLGNMYTPVNISVVEHDNTHAPSENSTTAEHDNTFAHSENSSTKVGIPDYPEDNEPTPIPHKAFHPKGNRLSLSPGASKYPKDNALSTSFIRRATSKPHSSPTKEPTIT